MFITPRRPTDAVATINQYLLPALAKADAVASRKKSAAVELAYKEAAARARIEAAERDFSAARARTEAAELESARARAEANRLRTALADTAAVAATDASYPPVAAALAAALAALDPAPAVAPARSAGGPRGGTLLEKIREAVRLSKLAPA
jgi:hypothetical protein